MLEFPLSGFNRSRIEFKMSLLAFRCLNDSAPRYLAIECTPVSGVTGRSHLRSAASGDFLVPACQTLTIGPRAFIVACPRAWNSLPRHLRRPGISLPVFKKELKTELFRRMLDDRTLNHYLTPLFHVCYLTFVCI